MKISLKYTDDDWHKLDLDKNEKDWETAIHILESRINERYFNPVDVLLKSEKTLPFDKRSFGFSILAIDCLLVEMLQSFIEGRESSEGKSKKVFVRFLTTRPKFKEHFKDENLANKFYSEYRSGILHQGEVQGDGLLWSIGEIVMNIENRIVVNRTSFHEAIKDEFSDYLNKLRSPTETNLRKNFRKKMSSICNR